ncbi:hypothetical protein GDO78_002946 [Eleutherodactylus coqui]|uniref:Uncharacterized protein n=1 Tax=Eleutherodactylus coqui TaxID=57060 RepID=A0A8J6EVG2_ELECQ|nr:hypothetical protein GDO78_002946 [Eleutherodactylus coqui]
MHHLLKGIWHKPVSATRRLHEDVSLNGRNMAHVRPPMTAICCIHFQHFCLLEMRLNILCIYCSITNGTCFCRKYHHKKVNLHNIFKD